MKGITAKGLCLLLLLFPLISFAGWGREVKDPYFSIKMMSFIIILWLFSAIFVGLILSILIRLVLFLLNSFNVLQSSYISDFKENKKVRFLTILGIVIVSAICIWITSKFFISAFIVGMIWGFITGISFRFFLLRFT
ncbi:MAG TPA: hypothetical protein VLZ72_05055 [Flavobacterium sp.]|nr:hypothetical protein [Flavobacterium sp.]